MYKENCVVNDGIRDKEVTKKVSSTDHKREERETQKNIKKV